MNALIFNRTNPLPQPVKVVFCSTFFTKLRGLMFRKKITPFSGILLVDKQDSVLNSAIHMLFMNFDICAVWINKSGQVVDKQLARRWHLLYKSRQPASMVLELHPRHLSDFNIDDMIYHEVL
jgi:uncharacterized membrane protein (UPF0127 family)